METKDGEGKEKPSGSETSSETKTEAGSEAKSEEKVENNDRGTAGSSSGNKTEPEPNTDSKKENSQLPGQGTNSQSGGRDGDRRPPSPSEPVKLTVGTETSDGKTDGSGSKAEPGGEQKGAGTPKKRSFWSNEVSFRGKRRKASA